MFRVSAIRAVGLLLIIGALVASAASHAQSQPSSQAQGKPGLIFSRMVKKLIFASEEGEFTRPKVHAASRS